MTREEILKDARPMLFSTPMVQAIIDGRKTMTRRVVKPQPETSEAGHWTWHGKPHPLAGFSSEQCMRDILPIYARFKKGDIIYVRETFAGGETLLSNCAEHPGYDEPYYYKADNPTLATKWIPSLFMPKSAARLFLKVTDVRVERLQDISEEDAIKEGVERELKRDGTSWGAGLYYKDYLNASVGFEDERESFRTLWISINGADSWARNDYVFVIQFEKIEPTK
jgi:hypothetical protein